MPIVQCDASQLEWRTAVELSHDEVGLEEIIKGLDTHSLNEKAFSLPSRLIAKIYLFRTIFRGTGWSFANDPDFMHVSTDPAFWDNINEKFYKKYHGLDEQHHRWKEMFLQRQPIPGPLGRSWFIEPNPHKFKIEWTKISNYPVQGTGADIMMMARIMAYRRIKASGLECLFISTVHDSIVVDCPSANVQAIVDIFYEVFGDLIPNIKKIFGYEWTVPMTCECKFGPNMKAMTKIARSS